jgi:hypothetical protein
MVLERDRSDIVALGLDLGVIEDQLKMFNEGFPFLFLQAPAIIGNGIIKVEEYLHAYYISKYEAYNGKIVKFVPASGAATRMFKSLYEAIGHFDKGTDCSFVFCEYPDVKQFFDRIENFAFYPELKKLMDVNGIDLDVLNSQSCQAILSLVLEEVGLSYGSLPKGLIKFHSYYNGGRTAAAEHLSEGMAYAQTKDGKVFVHFTVSPQHLNLFKDEVGKATSALSESNVKFVVDYSIQKPETDTIAVNLDNIPFRDRDGKLVFRPAGHGALIENLNDIDGDLIFIKNIDNVVPDSLKGETIRYKKLLAGILLDVQSKLFKVLKSLTDGEIIDEDIISLLSLINEDSTTYKSMENAAKIDYVKKMLDRPIRVCGMVKNTGEPGGGPFIAINSEGHSSLQVVESSQIDLKSPEQKAIFDSSTHFNPVDLVCGVKSYDGSKFDLRNFRDPKTGFISVKSKDGRELKAMELPGLWNGAMSDWITLFVEVPIVTFNPVKTVNDLLRNEHQ